MFEFLRRAAKDAFANQAPPAQKPSLRATRAWPSPRGAGGLAGEAANGNDAGGDAASMWADDEAPAAVQQATPDPEPTAASAFEKQTRDEKRGLATLEAQTDEGKVSAKLSGADFTLRFPPGMSADDRQKLAADALRTMGVTVADPEAFARRLAAGEDVIKVQRELEIATPAEAAEQARRLFDMEIVDTEDFDASGATWDEQTLRTLKEGGDNGYEGKCSSASERWQKLMAAQGKHVPVRSFENGAATGHRYLVPAGGDVIIDPTFGQFFHGKWTELDGGKSQYEPFIGTYAEMTARVQQAIDAGLMKDFAPGSSAEDAIEAGWGIKKGERDGFELTDKVGMHKDQLEAPAPKEHAQP